MKSFTALKTLLTFSLLFYLFYSVADLKEIARVLSQVKWEFFLLAYGLSVLGILFSSRRWQLILKTKDITVPFYKLVKYYFIGIFYNNFLPGTVGGDAVKMYKVGKFEKGSRIDLGSSVFIDRFLGLMIIYFSAIGSCLLNIYLQKDMLSVVSLFVFFFVTIGIGLVFSTRFNKKIFYAISKKIQFLAPYRDKIFRLLEALNFYREFKRNKGAALQAIGFSLLFFFICFMGQTYFLLHSLEGPLSYLELLTFLPLLNLLLVVPISLGGLGVRESLLVFFTSSYGLPSEKAISVGILLLSLKIINSLIGAFFNLSRAEVKES